MLSGAIRLSRGWGLAETGVHIELAPFGTTRPGSNVYPSPKRDLAIQEGGAFIEFDLPANLEILEYSCGPRRTALIITVEPLLLAALNPVFVKVRRHWWEFWRTKAEKEAFGNESHID